MFLAKIIRGHAQPIVTEVCDVGWLGPPRAWARKTRDGAAACSETREGAIASARVIIEEIEHDEAVKTRRRCI